MRLSTVLYIWCRCAQRCVQPYQLDATLYITTRRSRGKRRDRLSHFLRVNVDLLLIQVNSCSVSRTCHDLHTRAPRVPQAEMCGTRIGPRAHTSFTLRAPVALRRPCVHPWGARRPRG